MQPLIDEEDLNKKYGHAKWASLMRFVIDHKGKLRLIDNGAEGHNETFSATETIHTTSSAAAASTARCFRKQAGKKLRGPVQLKGASRDMKSAYRQLPLPLAQLFLGDSAPRALGGGEHLEGMAPR